MHAYRPESEREWKQMIVRDLHDVLERIPDDEQPSSTQRLIRYLQSLLRVKQVVPPIVEIMTVIKEKKPSLYYGTRRNVLQSSNLYMLFQLEMDPELATKRLDEFMNG